MSGFGAYGKIPALGDFFRIRAQPAFVDPWDVWLQTTLRAARDALGARWHEQYMSAPIWRFSLPAGAAGPMGMFGVMMPSVDRVGRQFPLTLMTSTSGDAQGLHDGQSALYEQLEDIALSALDDDMTRDRLGAALADVPPLPAGENGGSNNSHWSAILMTGVKKMTCPGLPTGRAALDLFDPTPCPSAVSL